MSRQFLAAGTAATVELSLMQPLDVIKTRLQLQGQGVAHADRFSGTFGALRSIHQAEGAVGLWRGFVPGLAVVIPRRGLKFAGNSVFRRMLGDGSGGPLPFGRTMLAGGLAGACEAVVITPLEVVKIAMQSERATKGQKATGLVDIVSSIARGGIGRLYSGLGATVGKHFAHSTAYFAVFEELRPYGPGRAAPKARQIGFDLSAGFAAGVAAGTVNNPFDVVKTRHQVGAASGIAGHELAGDFASRAPQGVIREMAELVRCEGPRSLFKGYVAKVARLGPGSALIFAVYEQMLQVI